MTPAVLKVLSQKEVPQQLEEFMKKCTGLITVSRNTMKDFYPMWDRNDAVYRGERWIDDKDKKAIKRDEPAKVYVPLTHSQIQTFVSFAVMMLTQRDYIFELSGSGIEDEKPAKLAQAVLQHDLEHNKYTGVLLPQFLTDVARYGVGVMKTTWVKETCPVQKSVPDPKWQPNPAMPQQTQPPMIQTWQDEVEYLGNKIEVISPYRWFPDTRLPLTRYREGEFCGDENEYSMGELQKLEQVGVVAGLEFIPHISDIAFSDRRFNVMSKDQSNTWDPTIAIQDMSRYVLVTEIELRCNPAKTLIDDGVPIDETLDAEVILLVWIANDGRIIRIEDSGYDHNQFLYDAAQFFNDQSRVINFGLAELLAPMQDILDWLLNSRVTNVRKVIQNQLIVDPRYVDMQDLKDRNPIIRLKATPDGMSMDSMIKQLNVVDATTGHLNDMANVASWSKEATGIQENLLGQYAEGRRSAREASNVNSNGAARVQLPIKGLWQGALLPQGRKMLSNTQQGLDMPQLVSIVGLQRVTQDPQSAQAFLPVDRSMLYGSYDFLIFDATLPSQRMAIAAALAQAGDVLMKNPMSVFALNIDPKLVFLEWLELMGVKNAERFQLTPQRLQELMLMAGLGGNAGGPPVPQRPGGPSRPNNPQQPVGNQPPPGRQAPPGRPAA
jgi:hypothetical protein